MRNLRLVVFLWLCALSWHAQSANHAQERDMVVVIFVNGLTGAASDFVNMEQAVREQFHLSTTDVHLHVMPARSNERMRTIDGVEVQGERLATEVFFRFRQELAPKLMGLDKDAKWRVFVSVVGHSLGGLVARYAIGYWFCGEQCLSLGAVLRMAEPRLRHHGLQVIPLTYLGLTSPHLGADYSLHTPAGGAEQALVRAACRRVMGTSGRDLIGFCDRPHEEASWLDTLADPRGRYLQAMQRIQFRTLIGFVDDGVVKAESACMRMTKPRRRSLRSVHRPGDVLLHAYSGLDQFPGEQEFEEQVLGLPSSRSQTPHGSQSHLSLEPLLLDPEEHQDEDQPSASSAWMSVFQRLGVLTELNQRNRERRRERRRRQWLLTAKEDFDAREEARWQSLQAHPHTSRILHQLAHPQRSLRQLEICHNLQSIAWRRILLDLGFRWYWNVLTYTHPLTVGLLHGIHSTQEDRQQVRKLMELYAKILWSDYRIASRMDRRGEGETAV